MLPKLLLSPLPDFRRWFATGCGMALGLAAPALSAQTPAPEEEDDTVLLPTFTINAEQDRGYQATNAVSATRVATPIRDLPFAISAFTEQFIDDIDARDLFDIVKYAPGVTSAGREFTAGNTRYTIRGFDQLVPQRNGFVGTAYVDSANIARVEVVKGPASVLYGQIAPGGAVNYITKRPYGKSFTAVGFSVGTDEYARATLDANITSEGSAFGARLNMAFDNGFQHISPSETVGFVIAPSLQFQASKNLNFILDYEYYRRDETPGAYMKPNMRVGGLTSDIVVDFGNGPQTIRDPRNPGFLGYLPLPEDFNYASNNDVREAEFQSVNFETTWQISNSWVARANYTWFNTSVVHKLTGIADANLTLPTGTTAAAFAEAILRDPSVGLTSPSITMNRRARLEENWGDGSALQAELAGVLDFDWMKLRPLVGAFFSPQTGYLRRREVGNFFTAWNLKDPATWDKDTDFDPAVLPITTNTVTDSEDSAVYGVLTATAFDDRLSVVAGARWNEAVSQTTNLRTNVADPEFTSEKITPQFGVGYKVLKNVLVYGSYSESFVAANRTLLFQSQPRGPAKPTTAEGYDIGIKADFFDERLSITAAWFQIDQLDRVLAISDRLPSGGTANTTFQGTVDRSEGWELEVLARPSDAWQIYFSYAYTDAAIVDTIPGLEFLIGAPPEASVEQLANVWIRYNLPGDTFKGWFVMGGANYTGEKAQRTDNPRLFFEAYTLFDLTFGWEGKFGDVDTKASLAFKNLTDEEYFPANQQRGLPQRLIASIEFKF